MQRSSASETPMMEHNYIGSNMRGFGFVMVVVVFLTALALSAWTFWNRRSRVIRAAQPMFLYCMCLGAVVMAASLVPMGLDDEILTDPTVACLAYPALLTMGWSFVVSALLAKTKAVHRAFQQPTIRRVVLNKSDILIPLGCLLLVNMIVLAVWEVVSPIRWTRRLMTVDPLGRPLESVGRCRSYSAMPFWVALLVINVCALLFAGWRAFVARQLAIEFAEIKSISMAIGITFIFSIVACPAIQLLKETNPSVFYCVASLFGFVVSMAPLLVLFIPKVERLYKRDGDNTNDLRETVEDTWGALVVYHPKLQQVDEQQHHDEELEGELMDVEKPLEEQSPQNIIPKNHLSTD